MNLVLEAQALTERDVPDYIDVDSRQIDRQAQPHPGLHRRALRGADGAASGGRILLALIAISALSQIPIPRPKGGGFCYQECA